jgi:hypothetical protein
VPSSTSSFEEPRPPQGPWAKTLLLAGLLVVAGVAGAESFARFRGFVPTLRDDADRWCAAYQSIRPNDPSQVVLVGASRMRHDLDLPTLAGELRTPRVVQLAVDGASPVPVLRHLSQDETFCGTAICDVTVQHFFKGLEIGTGRQADYLHHLQSRPVVSTLEHWLSTQLQTRSTFRLLAWATNYNCRHWLLARDLPQPDYLVNSPDRSCKADYSRIDALRLMRHRARELPGLQNFEISSPQLQGDLSAIADMANRIRKRGGAVIFVRLPTTGEYAAAEEQCYPRNTTWDVFARELAGSCIHWEDDAALGSFNCPDGSHLDCRDTVAFTRALGGVIRKLTQPSAVAASSGRRS